MNLSTGALPRRAAGLAALLVATLLATVPAAAQGTGGAGAPDAEPMATPSDETDPASSDDDVTVEILPVEGFLDPPTRTAIEGVLDGADERGTDLVVLQMSNPAVVGVDTAALADRIAAADVPVAVFVGPGGTAAPLGGGALELLAAADVRAAALDAELGPLTPLEVGDEVSEAADAAAIDRLAERWPEGGALFAEAGARATIIVGEGGTVEAPSPAELAFDRIVPTLETLLAELDGTEVTAADGTTTTLRLRPDEGNVRFLSLSLPGRVLHASASPVFVYLLLVVGLGMLLFEAFQPGFGVAGLAGLISVGIGVAGLFVFPVTWWGVALVVLGMLLYAADAAIAGFGPVTLAATAALVAGSLNFYDSQVVEVGGLVTGLTTATALGFFVVGMTVILRAQAGPVDVSVDDLVGRPGVVRSVLNPEGHVYVDGALWRARWDGEGRRAKVGTPVRVAGTDGALVVVEPFDPEQPATPPTTTRTPDDGDDEEDAT